jgi:hypothetical protein
VTRTWRRLAWFVAAALPLVAACSSDAGPSPAAYRRDVRAVCTRLRSETATLPTTPTDTAAMVRTGRRALALQRDALRRIRSFDAPAADERSVESWLGLADRATDALAASLDALAVGDLTAARAANARGAAATRRADRIARALDLPQCAAASG